MSCSNSTADPEYWAPETMMYRDPCQISPRKLVFALYWLDVATWALIVPITLVQGVRTWRASSAGSSHGHGHGRGQHGHGYSTGGRSLTGRRVLHAIYAGLFGCAVTRLAWSALRLACNLDCNSLVDSPLQRALLAAALSCFWPALFLFLLNLVRVLAATQMQGSEHRRRLERRADVVFVGGFVVQAAALSVLLLLPAAPALRARSDDFMRAFHLYLCATVWAMTAAFALFGFALARELVRTAGGAPAPVVPAAPAVALTVTAIAVVPGGGAAGTPMLGSAGKGLRSGHGHAHTPGAATQATLTAARNIRLVSWTLLAVGAMNGGVDLTMSFVGAREFVWNLKSTSAGFSAAVILFAIRGAASSSASASAASHGAVAKAGAAAGVTVMVSPAPASSVGLALGPARPVVQKPEFQDASEGALMALVAPVA